ERYLKEEPEVNSVLHLLARLLEEHGGPEAVHAELMPCTQPAPVALGAARLRPPAQLPVSVLLMLPAQAQGEIPTAPVPRWAAFATRLQPMAPSTPFVVAYRPYALVQRTGTGCELQVFDQPADVHPRETSPR